MKKASFALAILTTFAIIACKKPQKQFESTSFNNIFIVGNSITYHPPNAELDWNGNWGMAASVADSDYVHILTKRFLTENSNARVKAINLSEFEASYWEYDLKRLDTLLPGTPDLVIIRIGENVKKDLIVEKKFKASYLNLIDHLKKRNPDVKIICSPGFWKNEPIEIAIAEVARLSHSSYVEISVFDKVRYMAQGLFTNSAVAAHPGNKGMRAIADLLWKEIQVLMISHKPGK